MIPERAPFQLDAPDMSRRMITIDERTVQAPVARIFALARDVVRWPVWLAHYRFVRFRETARDGGGIVEMAANRPFGIANWPTWWLSEMSVSDNAPHVRFRHIGGITTGMDVEWRFDAVPGTNGRATHVTLVHAWNGPRWPLIGTFAATQVIGPVFVHGIASRTLEGLARVAEQAPAASAATQRRPPCISRESESTMTKRRVVITGIGCITPIGTGVAALWDGLRAERSAVRATTRFDASIFRSRCAAQVDDFDATRWLDPKRVKRLDRFGQLSVVGAQLAIDDARLDLAHEDRDRIGAMMGSALGGIAYAEEQAGRFVHGGIRAVDATLALAVFGGASSCNIAIDFGVTGPNSTNAMSCASGTIAIGEAFRQVRDGYADVMIAGGAEAPLATLCYGAFALIRAMSTRNDDPSGASRPFDRDRDGFVMGEGAAVLILEERERAVARGARIYAEVAGYGTTNDAHHMTAPLPGGGQAARCMRLALDDGGAAPSDIDYINAHGSSTPLNDPTETEAIRSVYGEHAYRIPVSSTKGYYGHALGASGAIEAAITALAMCNGWVPPTLNLDAPDDACDLDYVPKQGRAQQIRQAMSNSFGFGGINAALLLRNAAWGS